MPKTKTPFDHLALVPRMVAAIVAGDPYTGSELSDAVRDASMVAKVEAKRQVMTLDQRLAFANQCDQRCRDAYDADAKWFLKLVKAKDRKGLDQLYVFTRHWLAAYLMKL